MFRRNMEQLTNLEESIEDPNMQLMVAGQLGDIDKLDYLLRTGVDINYQDFMFLETALIGAARYGRIKVIEFLIDKGSNVNIQASNGSTALHVAVLNARTECVEFILKSTNIIKDIQDVYGNTAAMVAAHRGLHQELRLLAEHGCKLEIRNKQELMAVHLTQQPYQQLVGNHNGFLCLKELGSFGVDLNATTPIGMTPLHYAIKSANFQSVNWLISQNCDLEVNSNPQNVRIQIIEGQPSPVPTPLGLAVFYQNVRVVKLLLAAGCSKQGYSGLLSNSVKEEQLNDLLLTEFMNPDTLKLSARRTIRQLLGIPIRPNLCRLNLPVPLQEYVLCVQELS